MTELQDHPKFKLLVTHPEILTEALDLLTEQCDVTVLQSVPPNREEILGNVKGMDALYWIGHSPLNAEVLDAAGPQVKAVSTVSAGIDYVDVNVFKQRNIPLGHTPIVLNDAVADIAMGLMLAAARRFHEGREKIGSGTWKKNHMKWMWGQEIRDATVGFFGFGGIGQIIAKRLKGFDIDEVIYTTRTPVAKDIEKKYKATHVPFDELIVRSDILFIAAPLTDATRRVFNATVFEKMKETAVLINIARGEIINQEDLYQALKTNQIFSAGLDVMTPEPLPVDDPLLTLPNLVLTPHLGSATHRTRTDMYVTAAHNVLRALAGEPMLYPAYCAT